MREWNEIAVGSAVSHAAAGHLHALAERERRRLRAPQPVLSWTPRPGLRAGQVVGVLSVPGASLEILPKIDGRSDAAVRNSLTRMLAVALGLPVTGGTPSSMGSQREDLLEILVRLFADHLLAAVRRGLPRRYRQREEDIPVLRGKLDLRRQIVRQPIRGGLLSCMHEELSEDTPLNRVLRAAVRGLLVVARTRANRRRLLALAGFFDAVGDSADPLREPVILDRTNAAFHRLHAMARVLLEGDWQSTTAGGQEGFALLFAMNDLFQKFVGRCIQTALAPRTVHLQRADRFALEVRGGGAFRLRPDIVVDGEVVIDTKWKTLDAEKPNLGVDESDVYQMLAYERAYRVRRLVLLYPWNDGLPHGVCRRWHVPGSSAVLDVATVDVADPAAVPSSLRAMVATDVPKCAERTEPRVVSQFGRSGRSLIDRFRETVDRSNQLPAWCAEAKCSGIDRRRPASPLLAGHPHAPLGPGDGYFPV